MLHTIWVSTFGVTSCGFWVSKWDWWGYCEWWEVSVIGIDEEGREEGYCGGKDERVRK